MEIVRPCLVLTAFLLTTSPSLADEVLGTWLRDNGALQVKFEPCGDAICGNIVWVKPGSDSKAKVGQRLFFGMQPTGANSWTGKAANPDSGSIYSGKMSVEGSNPQHLGLHRRCPDLQVGELEKSTLTPDRLAPLRPIGDAFGDTLTGPTTIALVRKRPMFRNRATMHRILGYALLVTIHATAPAYAEQSFDNVAGSWSGGGSMKPKDGPRERVRCKVDYVVKNTGQSVKMTVRCASDAYKMDLSANIDQDGTALSGNWFESQYRQGGRVSGQSANGLIEAKVESATITALLTVRTKGNRQTFVMESPEAWVSQVSIDLVRDSR